jgi:hypothetical protein
VVFAPFTGTGELVQSGRSVTFTTALLCPPWADTFFILSHADWHVRVRTSVVARRKLRRAMRDAGMAVANQISWLPPPLATDRGGLPG